MKRRFRPKTRSRGAGVVLLFRNRDRCQVLTTLRKRPCFLQKHFLLGGSKRAVEGLTSNGEFKKRQHRLNSFLKMCSAPYPPTHPPTLVPDLFGEKTSVDSADRRDALLLEPVSQRRRCLPVGVVVGVVLRDVTIYVCISKSNWRLIGGVA